MRTCCRKTLERVLALSPHPDIAASWQPLHRISPREKQMVTNPDGLLFPRRIIFYHDVLALLANGQTEDTSEEHQ